MERIKEWWETASPSHKRLAVICGLVLFIFAAVSLTGGGEKPSKDKEEEEGLVSTNLLMDDDPRELGMDALAAQLRKMEEREDERSRQLSRMERELKDFKEKQKEETSRELSDIKQRLQQANSVIADIRNRPMDAQGEGLGGEKGFDTAPNSSLTNEEALRKEQERQAAFSPPEPTEVDPFDPGASSIATGNEDLDQATSSDAPEIRVIGLHDPDKDKKRDVLESPLPSGSIMTGVLLHGVDAPATGKGGGAGQNHPVLVRVKKEAILPNRYRTDIRECHTILSGYGDLSSERAYFRSEKFSCITDKGEVVDVALKGYAVGEDGKLGLRGRVVSKQGAVIARTMWAGFLKGWGEAFGSTATGSGVRIQTDTEEGFDALSSQVQQDALQSGFSSGISDSMDRLAEFYIEMAESMVPVIEIDGGRKISMVITNGTTVPQLRKSFAETKQN